MPKPPTHTPDLNATTGKQLKIFITWYLAKYTIHSLRGSTYRASLTPVILHIYTDAVSSLIP